MRVLIWSRNRMREIRRAPRHEVDGMPLRRTGTISVQIPDFGRQYLPKPAHMFHRAYRVTHPEHAVYVIGGSDGGRRPGRKPIGTYIMVIGVSESHEK